MNFLVLREQHVEVGAQFTDVNGVEAVRDYGDASVEHAVLRTQVGVLDLSFRCRLCLLGADRQRFLNGQVTNNVMDLRPGSGCYAALITAKGKMLSDLNVYALENETLLDFEPGLAQAVALRLEKYIIADDVQVVDVAPQYGMFSVQGPRAAEAVATLGWVQAGELPAAPMSFVKCNNPSLGETYLMNLPRTGSAGFDLFVPVASCVQVWKEISTATHASGGRACGWQALEAARIEAGIPRFGADMDESNLPPEAGLDARAISYTKGCYIGQEIIARLRTYGQVAKALRGLRLAAELPTLPVRGDKLFKGDREAGFITSALASPTFGNIALGYVRREANQPGTVLTLRTAAGGSEATVVPLPFA